MKNTNTFPSLEKLTSAVAVLRGIAHPVRIQILKILKQQKQASVNQLKHSLGITQSMTSQHLAALKHCGVVGFHKEANSCIYYIEKKDILKVLDCIKTCCGPRG